MPDEILDAALDGVSKISSMRIVVFTGGEPTMRKGALLDGISRVRELGLKTRIVTNGWWGKTPETARQWAEELRDAGLNELSTSWDDFHEPYGRFESVLNAVRAARDVGLRVAVATINDREATYDGKRVRAELAERLDIELDRLDEEVLLVEDYPTPSGTATEYDVSGLTAGAKLDMGCREIIQSMSVHPDGTVKACCGHEQFYAPDLTIGSLREESLPLIAERAQHNLLYWLIHTIGPKRLLEELGIEGEYASICHACGVLLHQHREELFEYLRKHRDDAFVKHVLFDDTGRRLAEIVRPNKDEIIARLRTHAPRVSRLDQSASVPVQLTRKESA